MTRVLLNITLGLLLIWCGTIFSLWLFGYQKECRILRRTHSLVVGVRSARGVVTIKAIGLEPEPPRDPNDRSFHCGTGPHWRYILSFAELEQTSAFHRIGFGFFYFGADEEPKFFDS